MSEQRDSHDLEPDDLELTTDDAQEVKGGHGIVSPRDPASGLPTGKRQHGDIVITKEIDKGSPS